MTFTVQKKLLTAQKFILLLQKKLLIIINYYMNQLTINLNVDLVLLALLQILKLLQGNLIRLLNSIKLKYLKFVP